MPRWASSKVRKIILFNSYRSLRRRDRDAIVKALRSSRRRRRFCQTLSHFANPLDLYDQHFLLDMNFLGTPQLRAGVNVSFLSDPGLSTGPIYGSSCLKQTNKPTLLILNWWRYGLIFAIYVLFATMLHCYIATNLEKSAFRKKITSCYIATLLQSIGKAGIDKI